MSEEELARLNALAEHYGLTAAGVLRMLLKKEETLVAAVLSGTDQRWEFVKDEAARLVTLAEIPNLRVAFDEGTRTIVLTDRKLTRAVSAGDGVWFTLSAWPGSKLPKNEGIPAPRVPLSTRASKRRR